MSTPDLGAFESYLNDIAVVSANNIWAAGFTRDTSGVSRTLIEHWDGSAWSVVSTANPGAYSDYFDGIAVVSANDIWAVGSYSASSSGPDLNLAEHWNGSSWTVVSTPNPTSYSNFFQKATAISSSDLWAVGATSTDPNNYRTMIEHWNGSVWSIVSSPSPLSFSGASDKSTVQLGISWEDQGGA